MSGPRDLEITFAAAGEQTLAAVGKHVRVIGADSYVYLGIDNDTPSLKRRVGMSVSSGTNFNRIRVKSLIAQTVRLTVSDVPQADDQQDVAVVTTATVAAANLNTNETEVTVPATGSAVVLAADADQLHAYVAIPDTEPGPVYLGYTGINGTQGGWLGPGMAALLPTSAAIVAYNRGASAVVVSAFRMKRV